MKMTAAEQHDLGVIDHVVDEPGAGAHTDHAETGRRVRAAVLEELNRLAEIPLDLLLEARYRRYRNIGKFTVASQVPLAPPDRPGLTDRLRNLIGASLEAGRHTLGGPPGRGRDEPPARDEV